MENYYNKLSQEEKMNQLGKCDFMQASEFENGVKALLGKKIVIVGCGAQGLNQGLNMRDSGLDVSYALRQGAIDQKRVSFQNASENGFEVGTYEMLIPTADLVVNLTPDKQHTLVVEQLLPLMKNGATLSYSHGFNIVEEGMKVRDDVTVIMMAPKSPGSEVREEFKRGFGVPTLIAIHPENDPEQKGLELAKAYAVATGGDRAGVLHSSFVAEVKSDLMGEQTILCGVLQSASLLIFDKMVAEGKDSSHAAKLIQYGWEVLTEALKHGGISELMRRLDKTAQIEVYELAESLKNQMRPLFQKHMDEVLNGDFSKRMMQDWKKDDHELLTWRKSLGETAFEQMLPVENDLDEAVYFEQCNLMAAFIKSGVELAFEIMVKDGVKEESAYYESLHELPLIANTIARKKLYEMNRIISDTAEYGCYLFDHACQPLLKEFVDGLQSSLMGEKFESAVIDLSELQLKREVLSSHPIEVVGASLRTAMKNMQKLVLS